MSVGLQEKKEFIRMFLKKNQMKRRECVWILNYLISHEQLLERVHFVEEAHYCPRAMIMSTTTTNGIPFRFYKGAIMTADAEKSFHDIRLNPTEELYIQLNHNFSNRSEEYIAYLGVLEEHSYLPSYISSSKDSKIAEDIIQHALENFSENKLLSLIDTALDEKNEEQFHLLVEQLQTLKKELI